ncbi:hypothetical protein K490DRAFT_63441 [Saccharata proteae CBS 121410]|uniref:Uncharacterized protein n=1 Tax=Saccharata proteae CBS 121410 TaxID=1314787 RepID=A0A6A5YBR7_9PEZI|nr:hypothetical protein K490DRAFT_63441 [Saccharata proteae CBS 121410]
MTKKKHHKKVKHTKQPKREHEPEPKPAPKSAAPPVAESNLRDDIHAPDADDPARLTALGLMVNDDRFDTRVALVEALRELRMGERPELKKLLISPQQHLAPQLPPEEAPRLLSGIGNGTFVNRDLTNLRLCDAVCTLLHNLLEGEMHCQRFWNVVDYKHINYTLTVKNSRIFPHQMSIRRCGNDVFVIQQDGEEKTIHGLCLNMNRALAWTPSGLFTMVDGRGEFLPRPMEEMRELEREIGLHILRNKLWEACEFRTWDVNVELYNKPGETPDSPHPKLAAAPGQPPPEQPDHPPHPQHSRLPLAVPQLGSPAVEYSQPIPPPPPELRPALHIEDDHMVTSVLRPSPVGP